MSMFISSGASQCFHISCRYDENLIGGGRDDDRLNGLCMIHHHYSAQQNIAEKGTGGEYTFAQVMAANSTLSVAEFAKVHKLARLRCEVVFFCEVMLSAVPVRYGTFPFAQCGFDWHISNDER
jgi:hypothetical protein